MTETLEKPGAPEAEQAEVAPTKEELLQGYRDRLAGIKTWVELGHGTADDQRLIGEIEGKIKNLEGQK